MTKVLQALYKEERKAWVKNKQLEKDTGLSPDDLNDAVELLQSKFLVEWLKSSSTAPFKFDFVQLTALGRIRLKKGQ